MLYRGISRFRAIFGHFRTYRVGCQFAQFSWGTGAECLRSVRSVQFTNSSGTIGKVIKWRIQRERALEPNLKEVSLPSNFWKVIEFRLLRYLSRIIQILKNENGLFSCYIEEYLDFVQVSDVYGGGMAEFGPPWIRL